MTEKQHRKWQKRASKAGGGQDPLSDEALEIFVALMLERRTERRAGRPVAAPVEIYRGARLTAGVQVSAPGGQPGLSTR